MTKNKQIKALTIDRFEPGAEFVFSFLLMAFLSSMACAVYGQFNMPIWMLVVSLILSFCLAVAVSFFQGIRSRHDRDRKRVETWARDELPAEVLLWFCEHKDDCVDVTKFTWHTGLNHAIEWTVGDAAHYVYFYLGDRFAYRLLMHLRRYGAGPEQNQQFPKKI